MTQKPKASAKQYTINGVKVWALIRVSTNRMCPEGRVALVDFWVHFPKCMGPKQTGFPMILSDEVIFRPLWDYHGTLRCSKETFNAMIATTPVESDWVHPYEITPEAIEYARKNNQV